MQGQFNTNAEQNSSSSIYQLNLNNVQPGNNFQANSGYNMYAPSGDSSVYNRPYDVVNGRPGLTQFNNNFNKPQAGVINTSESNNRQNLNYDDRQSYGAAAQGPMNTYHVDPNFSSTAMNPRHLATNPMTNMQQKPLTQPIQVPVQRISDTTNKFTPNTHMNNSTTQNYQNTYTTTQPGYNQQNVVPSNPPDYLNNTKIATGGYDPNAQTAKLQYPQHLQQQSSSYNPKLTGDSMMYTNATPILCPGAISASWKIWPATRTEATECELPIALVYTPFAANQKLSMVNYEPVRSHSRRTILSPSCDVDFRSKTWTDPIGCVVNQFPQHYAKQINERCLPSELITPATDYALANQNTLPVSYCFVVDIVLLKEELNQLKEALLQALGLLPPDVSVALITFGATVNIYNIGFKQCIKSYTMKGTSEITASEVKSQLRLFSTNTQRGPDQRFLCRLRDVEDTLFQIIESLELDDWYPVGERRPQRVTGAAISAAVGLMETLAPNMPGRIMLFTGGVCTTGMGAVVSQDLSAPIRQHSHLTKGGAEAKKYKQAEAYYATVANRAVTAGHAIDIFSCALDQTGLAEMRVLLERTGGICVLSDSFSMNVFIDSLKEIMKSKGTNAASGYSATINLYCSKEISIAGAIGCCASAKKKDSQADSVSVGQGETNEWTVGVLHPCSSIIFYLNVTNTNASLLRGHKANVQIQCNYVTPTGERRLRVHTVAYPFVDGGVSQLGAGFDQEATTAAIARLAVLRADTESTIDTYRWLDRKLIKIGTLFGDYQKGIPESFRFSPEFMWYPHFMYHFRRGPFIDIVNNSPDETAFHRLCLLRENLRNTITMISPTLISYDIKNFTPKPVNLDAQSIKDDVVLLMDSYFHIVLWHGAAIVRWKEQGYHEKPEYYNLKVLLEAPASDATALLKCRLPCAKFISCTAGGSQERFLLARVNPSLNIKNTMEGETNGAILTEEVHVDIFLEHLAKYVCKL